MAKTSEGGRGKRKDPLLSAAVIKVSFGMRGADSRQFKDIYVGILRDFDLTDEEVEAYIAKNRERVEKLARGNPDQA